MAYYNSHKPKFLLVIVCFYTAIRYSVIVLDSYFRNALDIFHLFYAFDPVPSYTHRPRLTLDVAHKWFWSRNIFRQIQKGGLKSKIKAKERVTFYILRLILFKKGGEMLSGHTGVGKVSLEWLIVLNGHTWGSKVSLFFHPSSCERNWGKPSLYTWWGVLARDLVVTWSHSTQGTIPYKSALEDPLWALY